MSTSSYTFQTDAASHPGPGAGGSGPVPRGRVDQCGAGGAGHGPRVRRRHVLDERSGGDRHWTSHIRPHPGLQSGACLQPPGERVEPAVVKVVVVGVVAVVIVVVVAVAVVVVAATAAAVVV